MKSGQAGRSQGAQESGSEMGQTSEMKIDDSGGEQREPKQVEETRTLPEWVERAVWTDRMWQRLETSQAQTKTGLQRGGNSAWLLTPREEEPSQRETTDWKAGCGRTACPVWREGCGSTRIPTPICLCANHRMIPAPMSRAFSADSNFLPKPWAGAQG